MFTSQIEELEQQLKQLRNEADEKERELYELRIAEEYVYEAGSKVEETIAGLENKYIETFKNYLLSLFDRGTDLRNLEPGEYLENLDDTKVETRNLAEEYLEEGGYQTPEDERESIEGIEFESGYQDLTDEATTVSIPTDPTTMQVVRPGVVYNSGDRIAYIGGRSKNRLIGFGIAFVDRGLAKDFRVESPPTVREIESKHQLKLIEISLNNIKYIAELNQRTYNKNLSLAKKLGIEIEFSNYHPDRWFFKHNDRTIIFYPFNSTWAVGQSKIYYSRDFKDCVERCERFYQTFIEPKKKIAIKKLTKKEMIIVRNDLEKLFSSN